MKKANYIAGVLLIIFSCIVLLICVKTAGGRADLFEAVLFPMILSGLLIAGSILMMALTYFGPDLGSIRFRGNIKEVGIAMLILLLAFPLLTYFGFIISTIVLSYAFLRLLGNTRKTSAVAAVLISISIYIVFHNFLNVNLPEGLILRNIL